MKDLFKNLKFLTHNRFIIFGIFFVVFMIVQYISFNTFFPSTETKNLWFYSGIFMVLFSILFIEPYYTSPKNVITNAIPLLLVFLAIKTSFNNAMFWWSAVAILISLLIASLMALAFDDKNQSPDHWKNKTATKLKDIVVIVGEEAHTIIPEWNFTGSNDKTSQGLVNSIGQITLQGRKYGVGFLVIAQRTANVSKTVLTQCNTVICFQAFDETSFTFLGNYVGKDLVQTLPNLKLYHAVVAGKAVKANMPMIIDLTR